MKKILWTLNACRLVLLRGGHSVDERGDSVSNRLDLKYLKCGYPIPFKFGASSIQSPQVTFSNLRLHEKKLNYRQRNLNDKTLNLKILVL